MRISRELLNELIQHAREDAPNECCGMVASVAGVAVRVYRAVNAEASPLRYSISPPDQYRIVTEIEDRGWDLGAIYHSHTVSPAYPSQTDVNLAFYPDSIYVILSLVDPDDVDVRGFHIRAGKIEPAELSIQ